MRKADLSQLVVFGFTADSEGRRPAIPEVLLHGTLPSQRSFLTVRTTGVEDPKGH